MRGVIIRIGSLAVTFTLIQLAISCTQANKHLEAPPLLSPHTIRNPANSQYPSKLLIAGQVIKDPEFEVLTSSFVFPPNKNAVQFIMMPVDKEALPQALSDLVLNDHVVLAVNSQNMRLHTEQAHLGLVGSFFKRSKAAADFPHYGSTFTQVYKLEMPADGPRLRSTFFFDQPRKAYDSYLSSTVPYKAGALDLRVDKQLLLDINRNRFSVLVDGKKVISSGQFAKDTKPSDMLNRVLDEAYQANKVGGLSEHDFKQQMIYGLQTRTQTYDADMRRYVVESHPSFDLAEMKDFKRDHTIKIVGDDMNLHSSYTFGLLKLGETEREGLVDITRTMTINLKTGQMSDETIRFNKPKTGWGRQIAVISAAVGASITSAIIGFYYATGFKFKASHLETEDATAEPVATTEPDHDKATPSSYVHQMHLANDTQAYVVDWRAKPLQSGHLIKVPQGTYTTIEAGSCQIATKTCVD